MAIKCPKCNTVQEKSAQCRYCGIDFDQSPARLLLQDPAVVELLQIYRAIIAFPGKVHKRCIAWVDRLSARIGLDLRAIFKAGFRTVRLWCRDVLDQLLTLLICGFLAWMFCVVLLSVSEGMWALYLETMVGKHYLIHFPGRARAVSRIVHNDPVTFAYTICLLGAKGCLLVAAVARILFFARGYYENRSVIFKCTLWVPACAAAGAWFFERDFNLPFEYGMVVSLIPALFMFHPCFELAANCLPEANLLLIFRLLKRIVKHAWRKTRGYFTANL